MPDDHKKARIIVDPEVREFYSNQVISSSFDGGAIAITFGVERFLPPRLGENPKPIDKPSIHVVCPLTLSPPAASALVQGLGNLLQAIQVSHDPAYQVSKPN